MRAGLAFAAAQGIATAVVDHRGFADRARPSMRRSRARSTATRPMSSRSAGFMRILGAAFVGRFAGRLVNVHPSLLPAFTGLHTHRRAIEAGCKLAGATVHFVTPELDHGPIVAQAVVPVLAGDTETTLAARVLAREHVIYPRARALAGRGRASRVERGIVTPARRRVAAAALNAPAA